MSKPSRAIAPADWIPANEPILEDPDYMAYVYHEYPKAVTRPDGKVVRCENEAEEEIAMQGEAIIREVDERKRLIKLAEVKGVTVDGRWSLARMETALTEAGFDANLDPFK